MWLRKYPVIYIERVSTASECVVLNLVSNLILIFSDTYFLLGISMLIFILSETFMVTCDDCIILITFIFI